MTEKKYLIFEARYSAYAGTSSRQGYRAWIAEESEENVIKRIRNCKTWLTIHKIIKTDDSANEKGLIRKIRDDNCWKE